MENEPSKKLLGEIQRREGEVVRVYLYRPDGQASLDLRFWYRDDNGKMRPTRKGLRIYAELIPQLKAAVDRAMGEIYLDNGEGEGEVLDSGEKKNDKNLEPESKAEVKDDDLPF